MEYRPQRGRADAEGDDCRGMIVYHGHHVGSGLVNFPVNEPLQVERASLRVDSHAIEIEFDDVAHRDQLELGVPDNGRHTRRKAADVFHIEYQRHSP